MRRAITALFAVPALLAGSQPASAVVAGHTAVNVRRVTGGFQVCLHGSTDPTLRLAGTWRYTVIGLVGSTGNVLGPVTSDTASYNPPCMTYSKSGTGTGFLVFTLSYVGVGVDVVGAASGVAAWDPNLADDFVLSTSN